MKTILVGVYLPRLRLIFDYSSILKIGWLYFSEFLPVFIYFTQPSDPLYDAALPPISEPTDFGKDKPTSRCQTIHLM